MDFALIPFFIAANITGEQTDAWRYGPEYTFDASISYLISGELSEKPYYGSNVSTALKCRPRMPDRLQCRLEDTTVNIYDETRPERMSIDEPFEIKFNQRGVESLLFREPVEDASLIVIRSVATQLSAGTDLKERLDALPAFVDKENFLLGQCATLFTVLQYDTFRKRVPEGTAARERGYSLDVVALRGRRQGMNVVIEKRTEDRRCTKADHESFMPHETDMKVGKSFSKIQIGGQETYKSQTEIHVKVSRTYRPKDSILRCIIGLELTGIEPAKVELPAYDFEKTASLAGATMQYNFIL